MKPMQQILLGGMLTGVTLAGVPLTWAQQNTGTPGSPSATTVIDGRVLPPPAPAFGGEINLNASQSKPCWTPRVVPPKARPTYS